MMQDTGSPLSPSRPSQAPPSETSALTLGENALVVDISDALSEKDKVKFTVRTKTTIPEFQKRDSLVVRQHEEFVWLHDCFEENPKYGGYIIPPAPPRPDFDASREKLQRFGEGDGMMTKEECTKMKKELEAEYLATFKKTVAMHEMFLTRLATHAVFKHDQNLRVFLEFDQDLCARPRGKLQLFGGLIRSLGSTTDQYYLGATVREVDEYFEEQMLTLTTYNTNLKDAVAKADRMTSKHKSVADSYIMISSGLLQLATMDGALDKFLSHVADTFDAVKKTESRVASDEDLKLSDTLRYYMRDSNAAKALLTRLLKCQAAVESANRNVGRARMKNKEILAATEIQEAEKIQQEANDTLTQISNQAREELELFNVRRVKAFNKNFTELAELELKHASTHYEILKKAVATLSEL